MQRLDYDLSMPNVEVLQAAYEHAGNVLRKEKELEEDELIKVVHNNIEKSRNTMKEIATKYKKSRGKSIRSFNLS